MLTAVEGHEAHPMSDARLRDERIVDVATQVQLRGAPKDRGGDGGARGEDLGRILCPGLEQLGGCMRRLSERPAKLGECLGEHDCGNPSARLEMWPGDGVKLVTR